MRLNLDAMGHISDEYTRTFFRVSAWGTDRHIADFDNKAEAVQFAITDSGRGNIDHKVSTMHMTSA